MEIFAVTSNVVSDISKVLLNDIFAELDGCSEINLFIYLFYLFLKSLYRMVVSVNIYIYRMYKNYCFPNKSCNNKNIITDDQLNLLNLAGLQVAR